MIASGITHQPLFRKHSPVFQFFGILMVLLANLPWLTQTPQVPQPGSSSSYSIFGEDDRIKIADTHVYPWSAIALIRIYWTPEDLVGYSCTGWMIGPSALATAAHCIYQDKFPYKVVVKPAMNQDDPDQTPFGSCSVIDGVVPDEWRDHRDIRYDYGVYHLGCDIGLKTGTLKFKVASGDWTQKTLRLTGYPFDKPGRTMWTASGKVTSTTDKGFSYEIDMRPGQSGSPVWDESASDGTPCVVAINSSEYPAPAKNFGVKIDQQAYQFLLNEMNYGPVSSRPDKFTE